MKRYLILKKKGRLSVLIRVSLTGCNWTFEVVVAVVVVVLVFLAGKKQLDENGEVGVVVCVCSRQTTSTKKVVERWK